jgi:hypothetical protein
MLGCRLLDKKKQYKRCGTKPTSDHDSLARYPL